jgi:glucose-6-phosphate-specific signal transduction histidine kinase
MFWGLISNQLNKELVAKEGLVRELVKQRTLIIESEEETRQLVSKYLHNNLQSGLVVINHQLSEAIKDLPEDSKARFQSILQELELMRKVEIRDASKALSPNLDVLDLEMLIAPLVDVYRSSMVVRVKSSDIEYSSVKPIALAVYRIVEQVLLNATVHGRAKSTTVEFVKTNKGSIQLTITNDGQPINLDSQSRGTGTAIVDTWVSSLEGSWNMSLTDSGATSFRCNLTLPSS